MFLLSNFLLSFILLTCAFTIEGLDKLISIVLFVGIIFFSNLFNKLLLSVNENSKIIDYISRLFKGKLSKENSVKYLKLTYCFISILVWLVILSEIICLASGHALITGDPINSRLFCICAYLLIFYYSLFCVRTIQQNKNSLNEAQWYRLLQYFSVYQFVFGILYFFMYYLGEGICFDYYLYTIHDYSIFIVLAYLFCLVVERILDSSRIISALLKAQNSKFEIPFFVSILASSNSFKESLVKTIELISGVNLSKSEMAGYILNNIEPVTIVAIIIFWLLSSIVIIQPDQEAIFYKMGSISSNQSYKPGIHFKLPWPFERMKLFKPGIVKILNIGFTPDPKQKNIIWAKAHAKENFSLLVGDGVEIVACDCQVFYKINDLYKYVTKIQNPEAHIEALAYKLLTANTISKNFDQIMSQNRKHLISSLCDKLQSELNKEDIGVKIVDIVFLAIHPPLEVADVYEDVISAKLDKQTSILKANSESIKELCMKKAFAKDEENKAKSYALTTVANAIGEAVSFESRIVGYNTDSDLEKFRLKLDSIQKMAKSKNLYIIDKSFLRQNDRIMLNLQN